MNIFLDDFDRKAFLAFVDRARIRFKFDLLTFCLMSNHIHLLIRVRAVPLDRIMQTILSRYSRRFNKRTGSKGHVFEDRYGRKLVRTDRYLAMVIRYIHGNPVAAGMVSRAEDWPWSSARQFKENAGGIVDIEIVRELFGDEEFPADLFEAALEIPDEAYLPQKLAPCFDEIPAPCPDLLKIADDVLKGTAFALRDLQGPSRFPPLPHLRALFFQQAILGGARNTEAAKFLNRSEARVTAALRGLTKLRKA